MNIRSTTFVCALAAGLLAAACSNNPAQPLSPSSSDAPSSLALTASIVAPRPVSPPANSQITFGSQPVTLTVSNAVVTKPGGTTYTFEVATDSAFSTKVQTKDGVAEGSGQTSVTLDQLAASKDYYWHARATAGGTTGVFSAAFKFTIGAAISLAAPAPIAPLTNSTTSPRPALRVSNATHSGPTGAITYKFEVSNNSTFTGIVATATVNEGVNETGFIPTTDLPVNQLLYWHAFAIDAGNGLTSAASSVQTFTARAFSQAEAVAFQLGQTLWTGVQPPGTVGHATMGSGWAIGTYYYAPGNVLFDSPDIEMLRVFDLLDRGFIPDDVNGWMTSNGYPTDVVWYPPPEKAVLGLKYVYLASRNKVTVNGTWDVVIRVE